MTESRRLTYTLMSAELLDATARADRAAAAAASGLPLPDEWFSEPWFATMRLAQVRDDPRYAPWGPRALTLTGTTVVVGRIGFHTAPGPDYLEEYAPGGVEIGYTIYPGYRGRGYATEACGHLMAWARSEHGVSRFVLSISPTNTASLRIAEKLGFARIGEHDDPDDGLEWVFATGPDLERRQVDGTGTASA